MPLTSMLAHLISWGSTRHHWVSPAITGIVYWRTNGCEDGTMAGKAGDGGAEDGPTLTVIDGGGAGDDPPKAKRRGNAKRRKLT